MPPTHEGRAKAHNAAGESEGAVLLTRGNGRGKRSLERAYFREMEAARILVP